MTELVTTGVGVLLLTLAIGASAEPPTPAPPATIVSTPSRSPFEQLSPGNRRTATALFEAQKTSVPSAQRLTLDQISSERRSGKKWGEIFQTMKTQGLIQAETLSQVLGRHDRARYDRRSRL